jgi:hypothetical protein
MPDRQCLGPLEGAQNQLSIDWPAEYRAVAAERDRWKQMHEVLAESHEALVETLQQFIDWSEAYPIDIFPEPDLKRAHELLRAGDMTLDAISASIMRDTLKKIGEKARAALDAGEK